MEAITFLYLMLAFAAGLAVAAYAMRQIMIGQKEAAVAALQAELNVTNRERQNDQAEFEQAMDALRRQNAEALERERQQNAEALERERQQNAEALEQERQQSTEALERERRHSSETLLMQKEVFGETISKLREEVKTTTDEVLRQRQEQLRQENGESMGRIVDPLQKELERMGRLLNENREGSQKTISTLEGQIKAMMAQTQQVGNEAKSLAEALKNKGKVHGDWGEHVLDNILEASGLRKGEEYLTQESYKGNHGEELRPDVVVKCANGQCIIIDSKVNLTAYTDAFNAETDAERQDAIRRNYESVRNQWRNLAGKQYPKYVEGAMSHVFMFMPNEGAYIMAMNYDPTLATEAYANGVIIVNPTNLMLSLNLVLQTWQATRQENNCQQIIDAAGGLYDKLITLTDTLHTLSNRFTSASETLDQACLQLCDGRGNLLGRAEKLKEMGVKSTKRPKVKVNRKEDPLPDAEPLAIEDPA